MAGCAAPPGDADDTSDEPASPEAEAVGTSASALNQTYVGYVGDYPTWCKTSLVTASGGNYCSSAFQSRSSLRNGCIVYVEMRDGSYGNFWGRKSFTPSNAWTIRIQDRRNC